MWAAFERLISPGLGTCLSCHRPWKHPAHRTRRQPDGSTHIYHLSRDRFFGLVGVESHMTSYGENGRGCFPLCEGCWAKLTPEERVHYYRMLYLVWEQHAREAGRPMDERWDDIEEAVLAGG